MCRPVADEQLEGLCVGQMAVSAADPFFQMGWVFSMLQHGFVVISFEEDGVAMFKIADDMIARGADVSEYTDGNVVHGYYETMWVCGIMQLGEGKDI